MDAARKECMWCEQCGADCPENCPDYTPLDDSKDEEFYYNILKENSEEYQSVEADFSDKEQFGGVD